MSRPAPYSSYPPPRYHGLRGEASARLRRHDAPHDLTYRSGGEVDYLSTGADTDQGYGLYRWVFGPGESGPEPHFHRTMSEAFYVLSGTVRIYDGRDWAETGPGDYVYVPPGGVHGFRNVEGEPASMLILFAPGAPREAYFEGLAALAGQQLGDEEREDFLLRHDNVFLEP